MTKHGAIAPHATARLPAAEFGENPRFPEDFSDFFLAFPLFRPGVGNPAGTQSVAFQCPAGLVHRIFTTCSPPTTYKTFLLTGGGISAFLYAVL